MKSLFDAFWRAAAYCLHPRVIALSVLPLLLMAGLSLALGYFYWEAAVAAVRATLESWALVKTLFLWLESVGLAGLKAVLAPLVVVFLSTPVIVVLALLAVAVMMTPAIIGLVGDRRFQQLEKKRGGSLIGGAFGALGATLVAMVAMVLSVPLWLVPPLVLVLPPLIWGWLTYRVMSYDVLADHASREERQELMRRHRGSLLAMGVVTGYLGAAPSLIWASGAFALVFAPVLVPLAVWIYTLVFAFSSLWFAHYALAALQALRLERGGATPPSAGVRGAGAGGPVVDVLPIAHSSGATPGATPGTASGAPPRLPPSS